MQFSRHEEPQRNPRKSTVPDVLKVTFKDEANGPLKFTVHAKPRAKKSAVLGVANEELDMALAAPPVDGAANEELVRALANVLGLPKRAIVLVRGESSRHKLVEVSGLGLADLLTRLGLA